MNRKEFSEMVGTAIPGHGGNAIAASPPNQVGISGGPLALPPDFDASRWGKGEGIYFSAPRTADRLEPGLYRPQYHERYGPVLVRQSHDTDNLIEMPDDSSRTILEEFKRFWDIEPEFRSRGFMHKRGYLLWGPPGGGKTSLVAQLSKRLITTMDGVVVIVSSPEITISCLSLLRKIEPRRPLIAVYEDVDDMILQHGESGYLALMDGEHQVDSIVNVATTNYPERLDPRFVDRPSRFDTITFVGMPSDIARRTYFESRAPDITGAELDRYVHLSEGYSIAHLKEMIIATKCFGQKLEDVLERMEAMRYREASSEQNGRRAKIGLIK